MSLLYRMILPLAAFGTDGYCRRPAHLSVGHEWCHNNNIIRIPYISLKFVAIVHRAIK